MTIEELLKKVCIGQMIRVVFINEDGDEDGTFVFENDRVYEFRPGTKDILKMDVEYISSTEDDYLKIEVYKQ